MKPTQWVGLVTNASPHAIPPGATVDQVNLGTETPGQLTVRGGMRVLATLGGNTPYDIHGYVSGGYYYAIYLTSAGGISWVKSPQYQSAPSPASEPTLAPTGKLSSSSYTQRCKSPLEDL